MGTLTAGNFTSKDRLLFIWNLWSEPWKIKALQKWMLVLLSEPACKHCWTRHLGGEHGLFQADLFAGVPKGPSKKPTEMMPWNAGLIPPVVNDQRRHHGAKGEVEEGKGEPSEHKATNGRSFFPPVFHIKWPDICHHKQTPLHGRITASHLEATEDFHILQNTYESSGALYILHRGQWPSKELPQPLPHILLDNLAFKAKYRQ